MRPLTTEPSDFWRVDLPMPELPDTGSGYWTEVSFTSTPLCGHSAEAMAELEAWNRAEQERREAEYAALTPLERFRLDAVADRAVGVPQGGRHRRASRGSAARHRGSRRGASRGDPDDGESEPPGLRLWRHPRYGRVTPNLLKLLVAARAGSPDDRSESASAGIPGQNAGCPVGPLPEAGS